MTPDNACFDLIRNFEGLRLSAYKDSAGIWTIGYGSILYENNIPVKKGDTITMERAVELLEREVIAKSVAVNAAIGSTVINQYQFDALVSFTYNVGIGALLSSTLLKRVKANPLNPTIRNAFMMWNKAHVDGKLVVVPGLANRRAAEADLYFTEMEITAPAV